LSSDMSVVSGGEYPNAVLSFVVLHSAMTANIEAPSKWVFHAAIRAGEDRSTHRVTSPKAHGFTLPRS
jgi:hypothetical protein